jgi:uncharacterized OB-fold protein
MGTQIPMVDYLVLNDGDPHLVAKACDACGALYLDRRNACAKCGGDTFSEKALNGTGTVRAFTIVHRAAPGVPTPYVSAVVDLDGGGVVKANLVDVEPDPAGITLGMPVRMTTFAVGTDDEGTEAIAFGYALAGAGEGN